MNSSKQIRILGLLIFGWTALGGLAWAQEPQEPPTPGQEPQPGEPNKPKPAGRGIPGVDETEQTDQNENWQADKSPLTGFQAPSLGAPDMRHSYWVPGLSYGSTFQSEPLGQGAGTGWYANNYLGGDVSLLQSWSRNQLGLNYSGGGYFTNSGSQSNGGYQMLNMADTFSLNRWQIQLFDAFSYIPESNFGFFGGSGVLSYPGVGGGTGVSTPGLTPGITPNQSVYSAVGPRYSNSAAAQITYATNRRGSITVGGSYGLLRFSQSGNVDSDMFVGNVGYNYQLSKTDTIGVFYQFYGFHYSGQPEAVGTNGINVAYGRKVTKKLAFSLYGGPQFTHYRVPIGTQSKTSNAAIGANLTYAWEHGSLTGSYFHGISGGGGALQGALTDTVQAGFSRAVARVWTVNLNSGYARNRSLGAGTAFAFPTFNDWFLGGGVSRPFGRNINFVANYTVLRESSNNAVCTTTPCHASFTQSLITVGIQWHARPFVLE